MATVPSTSPRVCAVIVTFNRKKLLQICLDSIDRQARRPDCVLVVDNTSTDGTIDMLNMTGWLKQDSHALLALSENTGGAGGFAAGMHRAMDSGADWIWMMDDDAEPHPNALEELMKVTDDPANVYGSLAVKGEYTSWTTTLIDHNQRTVDRVSDVPDKARVLSLPFLGFMIHRDLVQKIGLPDAGYFIAADDIEYCMRAERAGAKIVVAGKSHIEHPKSDRYVARLPGKNLVCLKLPPWKRYYDTRNRLLIARKYYGFRLWTQTIPGSFVRLLAALLYEPRRLAQLWSFSAGMIDGLFGRKGRRHANWGIPQ